MFGESESESPRVPSPWDSLISSPPSPLSLPVDADTGDNLNAQLSTSIPKLVPEAEEGNIEYKLQLLHPSPSRFHRLVTQLKWRLLEGGGQAYYEIGVADSGALVGLPRVQLEASLETLEEMAGEIGASVIVVKEIEVPRVLVGIGEGRRRFKEGVGNGKDRKGMKGSGEITEGESTTTGTTTELEDLSTTDLTDLDPDSDLDLTSIAPTSDTSLAPTPYTTSLSPTPPPQITYSHPDIDLSAHFSFPTSPSPASNSNPYLHFDDSDSLALFSMDPEPEMEVQDGGTLADAENDSALNVGSNLCVPSANQSGTGTPKFIVDLEISAVYKPRPGRKRVVTSHHTMGAFGKKVVDKSKGKKEKEKWPTKNDSKKSPNPIKPTSSSPLPIRSSPLGQTSPILPSPDDVPDQAEPRLSTKDIKFQKRQAARERKREERRKELVDEIYGKCRGDGGEPPVADVGVPRGGGGMEELVPALGDLHVSVGTRARTSTQISSNVPKNPNPNPIFALPEDDDDVLPSLPPKQHSNGEHIPNGGEETGGGSDVDPDEPRLIVEALVVRKMSIEEAFLDFGGFEVV
ncbi:hypothetical protein JAAARDRAFT_208724 [Jaapia argillacea MUCL 33604]|uniref:Uncharacterized protein n=1 Tax=Jaapia argillacea MUCL 33604 TaxID=933084 RepID=A0A067PNR3_9AGAM|nr:hypothetical protein JAAARDRAFT_208724 [Jaapia argillacea MUCL 33604]